MSVFAHSFYSLDPATCRKEQGYCRKKNGGRPGLSKVKLLDQTYEHPLDIMKCLKKCLDEPGATGCEMVKHTRSDRGCYVHTDVDIVDSNNSGQFWCWIFSKCIPKGNFDIS